MKFKQYFCENNEFVYTFDQEIKTFGDLLKVDPDFNKAFRKFALENEMGGDDFQKLISLKPMTDYMNGTKTGDSVSRTLENYETFACFNFIATYIDKDIQKEKITANDLKLNVKSAMPSSVNWPLFRLNGEIYRMKKNIDKGFVIEPISETDEDLKSIAGLLQSSGGTYTPNNLSLMLIALRFKTSHSTQWNQLANQTAGWIPFV